MSLFGCSDIVRVHCQLDFSSCCVSQQGNDNNNNERKDHVPFYNMASSHLDTSDSTVVESNYALSKYYTAPLQVYSQLQQHHMDMTDAIICTCGEWYRFPSSFYLPSNSQSFGFVASSFDGQLPQPFTSHGSGIHHETTFNDQNKPQANSITLLDDCNYLIDLYTSTDCRENDSIWKPIAQAPFLDADQTSMIHRALYIPYWHTQEEETNGSVQYVDYILYQRQED